MADDHETGNNFDASIDDHLIAGAFDYTEEIESPIQNLDADTEELDIPHFVGDLRALMVDDSEDEVALDSDDESKPKEGKIRGCLWRRVSPQTFDVHSSLGSNLTDKVTDNDFDERSRKRNLVSNNEIGSKDTDTKCSKVKASFNDIEDENVEVNESEEPTESSEANALEFVDHFLSISGVNSPPEVKIHKFDGVRTPFSSCAKGSQKLAMRANLMTKIGVSNFDWDSDHQPDHGGEFFLEKKKELDIQRDNFFGGNDGNKRDELEVFDFVFNTQMAAEAMEGLKNLPIEKPSKDFSFPLSGNCDSRINGISFKQKMVFKQKGLNIESSNIGKDGNWTNGDNFGEPKKKECERFLKVYKRRNKKQDSDKENVKPNKEAKTFSPVASRTRHGSSIKGSKRTENVTYKRKMGELKFNDTWKCPKKKRTCTNMRQNSNITSTFYVLSSVVRSECNFKEAFSMSSVKRKARSATIYKSTSGQPSLVNVSDNKCVSVSIKMVPNTLDGCAKEKIKDLLSNEKIKTPSIFNKKNFTSSSFKNELTRLGIYDSAPDFTSKDLRRRRSKVEIRVLFSQSLDDDVVEQQKKILRKLGTCMAKDCLDATHFVTDRFARTKKMLEAMALGKSIVTPLWLESCEQVGCIIDEKIYILKDAKKEKEIGFSMPISLSRARTHPLLKDQRVLITPNVKPDRETIENLVKTVHGQVMEGFQQAMMECMTSDNLLILSCEKDYVFCVPFLDKGASVYSSELLLNGIVIQKLEYAKHQLFKEHVIMKRYTRKRQKNGSHLHVCHDG